ncbi:MAG: adenosylmethionine decarboxylase [Bdellovibrionales bacterium]
MFEGSEKKFEMVCRGANWRTRGDGFWGEVVAACGARILSKVQTDQLTAFLLSESSLFVWDERVTMITCGRTNLARAAAFLIDVMGPDKVEFITYERKNEYYPHQQRTDFYRDVELLQARIGGRAFRFGCPDEHHLFLFHGEKPFRPQGADCTLEILMYNLRGPSRDVFDGKRPIEKVREATRLDQIFTGFELDDHLFEPCGYSANAIKGSEYYTIHVTPEEDGSYVSFETNVKLGNRKTTVLRSVTEVFQPESFDVIFFHPEKELPPFEFSPFIQRNYVRQTLSCGYEVGFSTYFLKSGEPVMAVPLEVKS